jgi:hypothetical protein
MRGSLIAGCILQSSPNIKFDVVGEYQHFRGTLCFHPRSFEMLVARTNSTTENYNIKSLI